jgi:DNA invertase Pin-like site-specific DNA recombinase
LVGVNDPEEDHMKVIGYVRVSTRQQAEGESLEAQEEAIRKWADEAGHQVVAVFADGGESGTLEAIDRPGLLDSLAGLETGLGDCLAMLNLGRLARALHVQEAVLARAWEFEAEVWEAGPACQVLQDDPDDPMRTFVRQVQGAGHQLEAGLIRQRLQGARRRKASRGGYVGGKEPYGWERVGEGREAQLVEVADEQVIIARMKRLRTRGKKTYRAIADALNAQGVPAKNGGQWVHTAVRAVLVRAAA